MEQLEAAMRGESIENTVFSYSYDGGDEFYPCGGYELNEELFAPNGRGVKTMSEVKRKVWIFRGESTAGKTFLSALTGLTIYETDVSQTLPEEIVEDIVVIGNRFNFSVEEVKSRINGINEWIDLVFVDFARN